MPDLFGKTETGITTSSSKFTMFSFEIVDDFRLVHPLASGMFGFLRKGASKGKTLLFTGCILVAVILQIQGQLLKFSIL